MPPDAASTAQDDSAAASGVDDYGFNTPDSLTIELSAEDEAAYVDKVLGIKGGKDDVQKSDNEAGASDSKGDGAEDGADTKSSEETTEDNKPAPTQPVPADEAKPDEGQSESAPELKTDDLWFEFVDGRGEKVRLTLDDELPDEVMFKDDKQLLQVLQERQKLEQKRDARQAEIDKWNAEHEAKENETKSQQEQFDSWQSEIDDLIADGAIPALKVTDPKDPKYLADPAVQRVDAVFKFMSEENAKRIEDGKRPITSFEVAFNRLTAQEKTKEAESESKKKAEIVKKRGAIVGGSASPVSSDKGYVYKRGSARNIWQVKTDDI